jgi:sec-independent protein translocase protein TatA
MELAIVLVIALVIFGPKRLPELGQSLGKGMREFKNSISGDSDDGPSDEMKRELTASSPATTADPPDADEEEKARSEAEAEVVADDRA